MAIIGNLLFFRQILTFFISIITHCVLGVNYNNIKSNLNGFTVETCEILQMNFQKIKKMRQKWTHAHILVLV